jgi:membrane-bound lytic murein transglycosylase D
MIREKLRARGMPEDLVYLSMIESGFNPTARSRVSAVGLWQFMAPTARGYGLRIDEYVDERRHPEKATDAALRHLTDLHGELGSWYLAAAAYNGGGGRVGRAMKAVTGRRRGTDADFWRIRHRLPQETRDYVPLMVAAALIGKEPGKYGLGNVERWLPLSVDSVRVPGGTRLALVGRAIGATEKELSRLNPHLVQKMAPPGKDYPVAIPRGRTGRFAAEFPRLEREAAEREKAARAAEERRLAERRAAEARRAALRTRTHTVRRGESLWTIARRNGITVARLKAANDLGRRSAIRPGQKLRIPPRRN